MIAFRVMAFSRPKGKTIHSEARNIIANVIGGCEIEKATNELAIPLGRANDRAAHYCGVSLRTISNIRKELNGSESGILSTPGKERPRSSPLFISSLDSFDRQVIRNKILYFYSQEKIVPTIAKLLPVVKKDIDFPFGPDSLRKILYEMGFKFKKTVQKRSILIERPDIVNWRHKYLRAISRHRASGKSIFYLDETWVDSNLTFKKCWQAEGVHGILSNHSSSNRLIVVHIGSDDGFVPGAGLIFKSGTTSGDYHGQMNGTNFEKWVTQKVIPNLKPASVVVMDNAPYHGIQIDKPPTKYATKPTMIEWLSNRGIKCDSSMRKPELFDLIVAHTPSEKVFVIDELLKEKGRTVLRLPPYMCDLNPIELAWAQIKRYLRERNTTGDMSMKRLEQLTREAIESVSPSDWKGFIHHTVRLEEEFWKNDGIQEEAIDRIVISLGADFDDSDDDDGSSSEEELATPL